MVRITWSTVEEGLDPPGYTGGSVRVDATAQLIVVDDQNLLPLLVVVDDQKKFASLQLVASARDALAQKASFSSITMKLDKLDGTPIPKELGEVVAESFQRVPQVDQSV